MNKIFVYTGTGNSLASAKQIAEALELELVHITDELVHSDSTFEGEVGVVIYPVYAYGMPMTVKRFIRKNKFKYDYMAVLTTCGSHSKGAFAEAIKLFKKRKQRVAYTNEICAVENYVHMFKLPEQEIIEVQTLTQEYITSSVIYDIKQRKTNKRFPIRPISILARIVFRCASKAFAKRYKITEQCNGCGICYKVCPANAIQMVEMDNGKQEPHIIPKQCDHCQACLQLCPKRAIRFGKIQPDSRRYKHSEITVAELLKR